MTVSTDNLSSGVTHIALIGPGLVGTAILQLLSQTNLSSKFRVVAIANSRSMVLYSIPSPSGDTLIASISTLNQLPDTQSLDINKLITHLQLFPNATVIDCTATDTIPQLYPHWLSLGIHVVTPNKKGFAGSTQLYQHIRTVARVPTGHSQTINDFNHNNHVPAAGLIYHESSVGAGLPILSTINDLIDSGDRILLIEGVLSGTLSYIFNEYSHINNQISFSSIVTKAKQLGYTEPDPRDDLNGMDVARKVIILARIAGLIDISMNTVKIESLVPESLLNTNSVDTFMSELTRFDNEYAKRRAHAYENQSVLRYVGRIDIQKQLATVGLDVCPLDHPLAGLKGADNLIRIVTERFPGGLVIQGAGAGDKVTAYGVITDLLRVHRMGPVEQKQ